MSTLKVVNIQHPSAASATLILDSSGNLALPAGSASTPALQGPSDTNTGLFFPAADTIAFAEGGTEALRIDSSGRVGIGTSSPSTTLSVAGGISGTAGANISGGGWGVLPYVANSLVIDSTAGQTRLFATGTDTSTHGNLLFFTGTTNGTAAERVRITGTGFVGINTTSPSQALTVQGIVNILDSSGSDVVQFGAISSTFRIQGRSATNLPITLWTGDTERARIDTSGRLLVGTSSGRTVGNTAGSIQIEGVTDTAFTITDNSNGSAGDSTWLTLARTRGTAVGGTTAVSNGDWLGNLDFAGHNGSSFNVAARISGQVDGTVSGGGVGDMPGRLVFSTTADGASSPTERMRINSSGITRFSDTGSYLNTASNAHEFSNSTTSICLSVYSSNANFTDSVLQACAARNTSNSTYNLLKCSRVGVADVFIVRDSGNAQNANNSYTGTSDAKLKENIVDATPQWDDIKALQVRKFNFKEETGYSTHTQIGLIAQEVEAVSPGLVDEAIDRDAEGNDLGTVTKSVNYSVLYMKAVKALQEAMERIEQLEAKVSVLESKP